jgi:glycosyltransferase involved in cell wall biosynthesis
MPHPSVSVCFPAYNESATLSEVIERAHTLLAKSGIEYEILLCNDASTDNTGSSANALAARLPHIKAFHNERNKGIRYTFEFLYASATKDFVFLNSTDGQWDTAILFDMLPLTANWDVIIASRKAKHYSAIRTFVSSAFNSIPRILFGVTTYDAGAVKLVRREIITRFTLVSRSPFSEAERLIRAARAGFRIREFPVEVQPRRAGVAQGVRAKLVVEALMDLLRVAWSIYVRRT